MNNKEKKQWIDAFDKGNMDKEFLSFIKRREEDKDWSDCKIPTMDRCGGCDECIYMQITYHYHGDSICYDYKCENKKR